MGLALATWTAPARTDTMPPEEYEGLESITASVAISGLSRFPDHVFYLFPVYCTTALVALDGNEADLIYFDQNEHADEPNWLALSDGPLPSWIPSESPCPGSRIYALAREFAAGVDLGGMSLADQREFFEEDPRLFRDSFEFLDFPLWVSKYSPLAEVREVLRVTKITDEGISIVLDSSTYRFEDGVEQTLRLAHTRRPAFPFKPLKPEKIAKYEAAFARWEAKQPAEPPPAPRLPPTYEDATTGTPPADATSGTPPADAPAEAPQPVEAPPPEAPPPAAPAAPPAPPATPAEPIAEPADAPSLATDVPEDISVEPESLAGRAWPLGAAIAGGLALIAIVALARRPRAGA